MMNCRVFFQSFIFIILIINGLCSDDSDDVPRWVSSWTKLIKTRKSSGTVENLSISPECQADMAIYFDGLTAGQPWAYSMADSFGGKESGLLSGNIVAEGQYDQCKAVVPSVPASDGSEFKTRYCFTRWSNNGDYAGQCGLCVPRSCGQSDVFEIMTTYGPPNEYFSAPYPQAENITYNVCEELNELKDDPGAIAGLVVLGFLALWTLIGTLYDVITQDKRKKPKLKADENRNNNAIVKETSGDSSLVGRYRLSGGDNEGWGGNNDVIMSDVKDQREAYVTQVYANGAFTISNSGLPEKVEPPPDYEYNPGSDEVDKGKTSPSSSTSEENLYKPNVLEEILLCFSIVQNVPRMLSFDHPRGSYRCLNAIRFLSMCWIVLGHSFEIGITITNTPTVENWFARFQMTAGRKASGLRQYNIGVETFFVLSALLTTLSFMKQAEKNDNKPSCVQFGLYYFHRFWRLTPVYMLIYMVWSLYMPYLLQGPLASDTIIPDACRTDWWRHLLYIQNLFPDYRDGRDCMGWMWYIANDFQFYVFAPVSICLLFWFPVAGIVLTCLFIAGGMTALAYLSHGVYIRRDTDGFYDLYVMPWARCTTYFIGILLGYLIFKTKAKAKMNTVGAVFGWLCAFGAILFATFPWEGKAARVAFDTLHRPVFGLGVFWLIYACVSGYGAFINNILSWRGWIPLAKLTYTGYLIHPIIILLTYLTQRRQIYVTYWNMIYYYLGTLLLTLGISFIASLLFEVPLLNLEKLMFRNVDKTPHKTKREREEAIRTTVEQGRI